MPTALLMRPAEGRHLQPGRFACESCLRRQWAGGYEPLDQLLRRISCIGCLMRAEVSGHKGVWVHSYLRLADTCLLVLDHQESDVTQAGGFMLGCGALCAQCVSCGRPLIDIALIRRLLGPVPLGVHRAWRCYRSSKRKFYESISMTTRHI